MTTTATTSNAATAPGAAINQTGTTALSGLGANLNNFLTMLMTQLRHQDPTQPVDASQFTSELVQFSSVEQQITTNSNLTQLIQLTQASQIEQSSAMLGKPATVSSPQLSLQNGVGQINFNTSAAEPLTITVYSAAGTPLQSFTGTSSAGANKWQWNGKDSNGIAQPDGAYNVTVKTMSGNNIESPVPFTVTGIVTTVQNQNGAVQLQMGGLTVPFSAVQSVGG